MSNLFDRIMDLYRRAEQCDEAKTARSDDPRNDALEMEARLFRAQARELEAVMALETTLKAAQVAMHGHMTDEQKIAFRRDMNNRMLGDWETQAKLVLMSAMKLAA